jgi:uncharacterized protein YkwD
LSRVTRAIARALTAAGPRASGPRHSGPRHSGPRSRSGRPLALGLIALVLAATAVAGLPARTVAATSSTASAMEALILSSLNTDRKAAGLVPLRNWGTLASMANDRAQRMADAGTLSHAVAGGDIGKALTSRGITWFGYGETIAASSYTWGTQAAMNVYTMWKESAVHHEIMFSDRSNYVGIGVVKDRKGHTWVSAIFVEALDHTAPVAKAGTLTAAGDDITFTWSGYDRRLQTHTAGLRSFDVRYRVDGGTWRTIRNDVTYTSLTLRDRHPGHWYSLRVQAADRRGTLSTWTTTLKIWVP